MNNPGQDPAEGSREIVERELKRTDPDRKKSSGQTQRDRDAKRAGSHESGEAGEESKRKN